MKLLQVKTLFTGLAAMLLLASTTFAEPAFANKSSFHHGHQGSQFQVYDKYFPLHNGIHFKRGHDKGFGKFSNRGKFLGHRGFGHRQSKFKRGFGFKKKKFFSNNRRGFGFGHNRSFRHRR